MSNFPGRSGTKLDYIHGPYAATFSSGDTSVSFNVRIETDGVLENDETFTLTIVTGSLPSRVSQSNPSQATVTIINVICKSFYATIHSFSICIFILQPLQ